MKLATLKDGTRDGQLAVVSRDLKTAHLADGIAPTLQAALNDWAFIAPQLDLLYQAINSGRGHRAFEFDASACMAPLPRTFLRIAGAAYPSLAERLHKAANSVLPDDWRDEPRLYQGAGDDLLGPQDAIVLAHEQAGIDFDAGLAVITDDVALGVTPDQAQQQIRLLLLVNDIALRNLMPEELANGYGFIRSRPALACAPVAITPDELGDAWRGGKVHLPLRSTLNGKLIGQPHAGADMAFNFPQLLAHLCQTRGARAGAIVGAGAVSNKDGKRGVACLAEKRAIELIADGVAGTPFMLFGDTIRIEMFDEHGKSLFGAIEQSVKQAEVRKTRAAA